MTNEELIKRLVDDAGFWGVLGLLRDLKLNELEDTPQVEDMKPIMYEIDVINFLLGVENIDHCSKSQLNFAIRDCLDCIENNINPQKYLQQIISHCVSYWSYNK